MQRSWGRAIAAAFLAGATMLAGGGIAHADTLDVSDELIVEGSNEISFGTVACRSFAFTRVDLRVERQGDTPDGAADSPVFVGGDSEPVTFSVEGSSGGVFADVSFFDTLQLPSTWPDAPAGTLSSARTAEVSVTTSQAGTFSGVVEFRVEGQSTKSNQHSDTVRLVVRWTVSSCAPPPDTTKPVVDLACPTSPVLLGSVAEATWTAADPEPGSGIDSSVYAVTGSVPLDTSSVGSRTAIVAAGTVIDRAGNASAEATCDYSVVFDFDGFSRPVDMGSTVNSVKAGSAVPIKFSLDGDQGLGIIAPGYPKIQRFACGVIPNVDDIEETVNAGGSSLSYDPIADQYVYVWKTDKSLAGSCGTFILELTDGTTHSANFQFRK